MVFDSFQCEIQIDASASIVQAYMKMFNCSNDLNTYFINTTNTQIFYTKESCSLEFSIALGDT